MNRYKCRSNIIPVIVFIITFVVAYILFSSINNHSYKFRELIIPAIIMIDGKTYLDLDVVLRASAKESGLSLDLKKKIVYELIKESNEFRERLSDQETKQVKGVLKFPH